MDSKFVLPVAREWTFFDRSEEMRTEVKAPMGGKVISVLVRVEDQVEENDEIAVLEAMKMELPVVSTTSGKVCELCVVPGQAVEAEAVLVVIEN